MKFHKKSSGNVYTRSALNGQQALFMPTSSWTPPNLDDLPSLKGLPHSQRIAVDIETKDPNLKTMGPGFRRGAYIIGLGVAIDGGPKFYLPVRHDGGGNLDEAKVQSWAKENLNLFCGEVVGANLGYDLDGLAEWDVTFEHTKLFHDVIVAEPLLDENKVGSYNLDAIGKEHVGEGKREDLVNEAANALGFGKDPKSNLWRMPANLVGAYAEGDLDLPLRILPIQLQKLEAEELLPVYSVEQRLIPILVDMRRRGIPVSQKKIELLSIKLKAMLKEWDAKLKHLAGPKAEFTEAASLAPALEERGIRVPRTAKTDQPSISKPLLEKHQGDELVRVILNGRKIFTLENTFVEGQIKGFTINGRVHPTFKQIKSDDGGTVGRLSGANPNMQFIPSRDADWAVEELAPLVREIFEAEDGEVWQRDDCSQVEYRFLTHYAVGQGAEEARAKYNQDPKTDYHKLSAEFLGVPPEDKKARKRVKITNFCKVYGGGPDKIAQSFACSVEEAAEFVSKYDESLPFVKATYEAADRWAKKRGFVTTILNRKQRFPFWGPSRYRDQWPTKLFRDRQEAHDYYVKEGREYRGFPVRYVDRVGTYTALCRKLQVSSADLMKKAMVDGHEAGITLILGPYLLTNHDELGTSIAPTKEADEAGKELTRIMERAVTLKVPVLVESSRGKSWGDCS